ncbi:uncharacterized protein LOC133418514 isoform X1 [Cololabis saira]|uniref:uncharacterized protein LOC133418514 isoform X1 n=1 Tax=Cololabis saira TaxID=129043 RepID=UPI002AD43842|nr:uncharacterized protein LOC133418514 isoform X1 [Cololabis saira]
MQTNGSARVLARKLVYSLEAAQHLQGRLKVKRGVMSVLLKEIRRFNSKAAAELEGAGIHTDPELQALSRQDLSELFPGLKNFQLRKSILGIIHRRKPVDVLLEDLRGFIPDDSLRDALSSNGILVDYLHVLKDIKAQVDNVQSFLVAHIGMLENISRAQSSPELCKAESIKDQFCEWIMQLYTNPVRRETGYTQMEHTSQGGCSLTQPPADNKWSKEKTVSLVNHRKDETEATQLRTLEDSPKATRAYSNSSRLPSGDHTHGRPHKAQASVKYKMLVTAQTFGAHVQLLNDIMGSDQELNLVEVEERQSSEDFKVIIVFCPIVSRPGTDIEAAMKTVRDDKPVILVLMHHSREAKPCPSARSYGDFPNVVVHVNVFYHEMVKGLIPCPQNQDAVSKMRQELRRYRDTSSSNVSTSGDKKNCSMW